MRTSSAASAGSSATTESVPSAALARVRVILVRPIRGANVGAVCRAIKNMGAGRLYVVGGAFDLEQARHAAVHAADVLDSRGNSACLRDALEGCSLVVGTTARGGTYRERSRDVRTLGAHIAEAEQASKAGGLVPALVFGPEDSGLDNEEIAACHALAFIPTSTEYASLNLAQAAIVCLYEVMRARLALAAERSAEATRAASSEQNGAQHVRADAAAVEDMYAALERSLMEIGFLSAGTAQHIMMTFRDVFGRAGLDERELSILRGVARQISWFAHGGAEVARSKRERGEKLR